MARYSEEVTVAGFSGLGISPDELMRRSGAQALLPYNTAPKMVSPDRLMEMAQRPGQAPPPLPSNLSPPASKGPTIPPPATTVQEEPGPMVPVAATPFWKNPMVLLGGAALVGFLIWKSRR